MKKRQLLIKAAVIFKLAGGGGIEGRVNSDFVEYVHRLFMDVEISVEGVPKSVQDFMRECAWITD